VEEKTEKIMLSLDEKWDKAFSCLIDYGNKNNRNCNVPTRYILTLPDNTDIKLGKWLSNQRSQKREGNLSQDRLDKLQGLVDQGKLVWNAGEIHRNFMIHDNKWNDMFNHLVEYGERHSNGNCNLPASYILTLPDNSEIKLGKWLSNQRSQYREGSLSQDRLDKLQGLVDQGKIFLNFVADDKWNDMYHHLLEYGEKNNSDCNVPSRYIITLPDKTQIFLGIWLKTQCALYKGKMLRKDRLERIQLLINQNKLRVITKVDYSWDQMYDFLLQYGKDHHVDYNVPKEFELAIANEDNVKLGAWLDEQKDAYIEGRLEVTQDAMLKTLVDAGKLVIEFHAEFIVEDYNELTESFSFL